MQSKFTGVDGDVPSLPHTVKTALTPALRKCVLYSEKLIV